MTDPPKVNDHRQLTVRQLPRLLTGDPRRHRIQPLIDAACTASDFARDWRNRHIAHRSLDRAIDSSAPDLEFASRELVERAIRALDNLFQEIQRAYFNSTLGFADIGSDGDADALLYVLFDGVLAREARAERFRIGEPVPDDWADRNV